MLFWFDIEVHFLWREEDDGRGEEAQRVAGGVLLRAGVTYTLSRALRLRLVCEVEDLVRGLARNAGLDGKMLFWATVEIYMANH